MHHDTLKKYHDATLSTLLKDEMHASTKATILQVKNNTRRSNITGDTGLSLASYKIKTYRRSKLIFSP